MSNENILSESPQEEYLAYREGRGDVLAYVIMSVMRGLTMSRRDALDYLDKLNPKTLNAYIRQAEIEIRNSVSEKL